MSLKDSNSPLLDRRCKRAAAACLMLAVFCTLGVLASPAATGSAEERRTIFMLYSNLVLSWPGTLVALLAASTRPGSRARKLVLLDDLFAIVTLYIVFFVTVGRHVR